MEDHKDGMKELLESGGITLELNAHADELKVFMDAHGRHIPNGPDTLSISVPQVSGEGNLHLAFRTTFAPGPEFGRLRCIIAGELTTIEGMEITPEDWRRLADKLTKRN